MLQEQQLVVLHRQLVPVLVVEPFMRSSGPTSKTSKDSDSSSATSPRKVAMFIYSPPLLSRRVNRGQLNAPDAPSRTHPV